MKTLTPALDVRSRLLDSDVIPSKECPVARKYNEVLKNSPPTPTVRIQSEAIPIAQNQTNKSSKGANSPQLRRHRQLGRTSSAPVSIPRPKNNHRHPRGKKQVTRVSSASGVTGVSPGGTHRITYDRDFLLECRQSPLSLTPPSGLPEIPGATAPPLKRRSRKLVKTDSNMSAVSATSVDSTSSFDVMTDELHHLEL